MVAEHIRRAHRASSASFDISMAWMCRWTIAGCGCTALRVRQLGSSARTPAIASTTSEFRAGYAGLDVPQPPRRPRDQRLDQQRHDVMIVGIVVVDPAHLRGVVVVPASNSSQRYPMRLLDPASQRLDQPVFQIRGLGRSRARRREVLAAELGGGVRLVLAVLAPGEVVERPAAESDSPMRHRAIGVEFESLEEALDAFLLVEAEAPIQPQIEPALRFGRGRGDCQGMRAEVEAIHF